MKLEELTDLNSQSVRQYLNRIKRRIRAAAFDAAHIAACEPTTVSEGFLRQAALKS